MSIDKIMIIGRPGSGKSTFAVELKKITNLPLIHIDKYVFYPNWIKKSPEECKNIVSNLISEKQWIIDVHCGCQTRSNRGYAKE